MRRSIGYRSYSCLRPVLRGSYPLLLEKQEIRELVNPRGALNAIGSLYSIRS